MKLQRVSQSQEMHVYPSSTLSLESRQLPAGSSTTFDGKPDFVNVSQSEPLVH